MTNLEKLPQGVRFHQMWAPKKSEKLPNHQVDEQSKHRLNKEPS